MGVLALTGPIFLVIAAGYITTRLGLFGRSDMRVFGKYVINIALPALLDDLDIKAPILIGHSDGASIALIHAGGSEREVRGRELGLDAFRRLK